MTSTRRFLLTWKSVHVYFKSETWSATWSGITWRWTPEIVSGMGTDGWLFHWLGILIERFCFDSDDWGEEKADDLAFIFKAVLEENEVTK